MRLVGIGASPSEAFCRSARRLHGFVRDPQALQRAADEGPHAGLLADTWVCFGTALGDDPLATGNNITFRGDMIRRGLVCNLEALDERPELRAFQRDTLEFAADNRGAYVAAALTIVRAYLVAGSPKVCGPFGSYAAWSTMVRSPLVWLGEPDPVISMEGLRDEDEELSNISEFVQQWLDSGLSLDTNFLLVSIVEEACAPPPPNYYGPQPFKELLLRIAATKNDPGKVSAERLGRWLRRI